MRIRDTRDGSESIVEVARVPAVIGRRSECDVVLPDPECEVSSQHVRLDDSNGGLTVTDLGSMNGTYLCGRRIPSREATPWRSGDNLQVGAFVIQLVSASPADQRARPAPPRVKTGQTDEQLFEFKKQVHERFLARTRKLSRQADEMGDDEFRARARDIVSEVLGDKTLVKPSGWTRDALLGELLDDFLALGPLEGLLADDSVTEIMVNQPDQVYVERGGKLTLTTRRFFDSEHILRTIHRIIQPLGRRIDESVPYVDARLKDGSRVHAIIPPLALNGPTLTIRKFAKRRLVVEDLIGYGSISPAMASFLELMVLHRANIVVSGGTGSGKTTLLNVLSNYIPDTERIVTVEDSAELRLNKEHVVSLEAKPANIEGKGAVAIRDLVRNTLRMRPDRIVVGECRGGEALDMLQAMNTGHDGSLTTVHANSPRDALSRLETLVLMAEMDLPSRAIREQISAAVNFVVQVARLADGSRKVTSVTELTGLEAGSTFVSQDIFEFRQEGFTADGKVAGAFRPTGNIPRFVERLQARGVRLNMDVFSGS